MLVSLLFGALLGARPALAERPVWTEEDVSALTERSINVMPWHQYVLRSMMRLDQPHMFTELALWGAPGRFQLQDDTVDGALMRFGLSAGFGVGRPRSGFAAFAGLQTDYGMAQQPPIFASEGTLGLGAELIGYGGLSYKGWMATFGALASQPFVFEETARSSGGPAMNSTQMLTLYNQEGVAVGGVTAKRITGEVIVAALRTEVQPERLLERLDLRRHGLFSLGAARYDAETNPYADEEDEGRPKYEFPLGGDDLGGKGFRVQLVPQVLPTPRLRRALVGYVHHTDALTFGGQAGLVTRRDKLVPTVQTHAMFRPAWFKYLSVWGVPRIAVSYSYNVPDPVAFFPVEGAHVMGVQYVYGPAEFGRPLVPIYPRDPNAFVEDGA